MYTNAVGTTRRGRFGRGRVTGVAAIALAAALGLGAIVVSPGGAATSKAMTMSQAEAALATLEALAPAKAPTLTEAGSSLFYPLWEEWSGSTAPSPPVPVSPGKGGSGLGQSEAENGTINIGGSDGFLPAATMTGPPAVLNIPVTVSAQAVVYDLHSSPATDHLKFSSTVLNGIYQGKIKNWDSKSDRRVEPQGEAAGASRSSPSVASTRVVTRSSSRRTCTTGTRTAGRASRRTTGRSSSTRRGRTSTTSSPKAVTRASRRLSRRTPAPSATWVSATCHRRSSPPRPWATRNWRTARTSSYSRRRGRSRPKWRPTRTSRQMVRFRSLIRPVRRPATRS